MSSFAGQDPVSYPPPVSLGCTTARNEYIGSGQFLVRVGVTSEFYLWNPSRSCTWFHRYSRVLLTYTYVDATLPPLGSTTVVTTFRLTWGTSMCLPCKPDINFSPSNLSDPNSDSDYAYNQNNALFGRVVGGVITVVSDSTSTTSNNLSGNIAYGIVNDSRMNPLPSGGYSALDFTNSEIYRYSANQDKDANSGRPLADGIAIIVGDQISPDFVPIDRSGYVEAIEGYWWDVFPTFTPSVSGVTNWFSPYAACTLVNGPSAGSLVPYVVPRIPLDEAPVFRVECTPSYDIAQIGGCIVTVHFFAYNDSDDGGQSHVITVTGNHPVPGLQGGGLLQEVNVSTTVEIAPLRPSGTLWIGSLIASQQGTSTGSLTINNVLLLGRKTAHPGTVGQTSVVKVSDAAIGQTILVTAKLQVQYVNSNYLAPYVQSIPVSLDPLSTLAKRRAFDSKNAYFKRSFSTAEYQDITHDPDRYEKLATDSLRGTSMANLITDYFTFSTYVFFLYLVLSSPFSLSACLQKQVLSVYALLQD
jgi:hypothetical protein